MKDHVLRWTLGFSRLCHVWFLCFQCIWKTLRLLSEQENVLEFYLFRDFVFVILCQFFFRSHVETSFTKKHHVFCVRASHERETALLSITSFVIHKNKKKRERGCVPVGVSLFSQSSLWSSNKSHDTLFFYLKDPPKHAQREDDCRTEQRVLRFFSLYILCNPLCKGLQRKVM